jgi:hypothetical protein
VRTKHPTGCTDEDRAKAVNHAIYQGTKRPQWLIDVGRFPRNTLHKTFLFYRISRSMIILS